MRIRKIVMFILALIVEVNFAFHSYFKLKFVIFIRQSEEYTRLQIYGTPNKGVTEICSGVNSA